MNEISYWPTSGIQSVNIADFFLLFIFCYKASRKCNFFPHLNSASEANIMQMFIKQFQLVLA